MIQRTYDSPELVPCLKATRVELDKKQHPSPGPSFRIAGGAQLPEKLHQPNPARNIRAKSGRFRRCYRRFHFRRTRKPVALHRPSAKFMREHVLRAPSSPPGGTGAPVARTTTEESPFHQRPHQRLLVTCNRVGPKSAPALRAPPFSLSMPSPRESRLWVGAPTNTKAKSENVFSIERSASHVKRGLPNKDHEREHWEACARKGSIPKKPSRDMHLSKIHLAFLLGVFWRSSHLPPRDFASSCSSGFPARVCLLANHPSSLPSGPCKYF